MYRVGVDVGGTNIAIGIVDPDLKIIKRDNIKTGSAKEPGEMVEAIAGKVAGLIKDSGLKESDIEMVGVGVPGTAELSSGKILYANNLGFEDVPFLPMLKDALGKELGERTFFENDANAAAIGEYIAGDYDLKEKVGRSIYSRSSTINTEIVVGRGIKDAGDVGIIGAALIDKM